VERSASVGWQSSVSQPAFFSQLEIKKATRTSTCGSSFWDVDLALGKTLQFLGREGRVLI